MHGLHSFGIDRQALEKPGCACAALAAQWGERRAESNSMTTTPAASWACGDAAPHRGEIRRAVVSFDDGRAVHHVENIYKFGDWICLTKATSGDSKWR
jgi:hypothetical protein